MDCFMYQYHLPFAIILRVRVRIRPYAPTVAHRLDDDNLKVTLFVATYLTVMFSNICDISYIHKLIFTIYKYITNSKLDHGFLFPSR